jgi:hypothetical protein
MPNLKHKAYSYPDRQKALALRGTNEVHGACENLFQTRTLHPLLTRIGAFRSFIDFYIYTASDVFKDGQVILHAVMLERIGERHASACRYKNEIPLGSRHRTHCWSRRIYNAFKRDTEDAAESTSQRPSFSVLLSSFAASFLERSRRVARVRARHRFA